MAGHVSVVGLGPGDPTLRTVGAQRQLDQASRLVLRTRTHPGIEDLADDRRVLDCDDLYETLPTFEAVYEAIAERVCRAAADDDVVFAVPGSPRFGERSVAIVQERAAREGIVVRIGDAVSAFDVAASAVGVDPLADQVQLVDAHALESILEQSPFAGGHLGIDPSRPVLVFQVHAPAVAVTVKLSLARLFPDDHLVSVVRAAGVPGEASVVQCRLHELDRQPVDHLTSVWVPPLEPLAGFRGFLTLQRIVARLRAPNGCPWDRAQTHATLRDAIIEEAFEAADAIDNGDANNLAEELGDLLLQVALHAQIAEEQGDFVLEDVIEGVNRKLVRRHPHVFGDIDAATPEAVVRTWDAIKTAEKRARGVERRPSHPLDRLPRALPALQRVAAVLRTRKFEAPQQPAMTPEEIGEHLFNAVRDAVALGHDPEKLLDAAARRHIPADDASEDAIEASARQESIPA